MEDDSEWSPSGTGSPDADPANNAPTFSGGPRTFSVAENTPAGENIRGPVTATDPDRDSLAYSLEGTDAVSFYIDPATGQIQTSGPLNHEEKPSHSVTVKADDARGGMATVSVTINVTDVPGEAPEKPDTPTVRRGLEHEPSGQLGGAGQPRSADYRLRLPLQGADGGGLD